MCDAVLAPVPVPVLLGALCDFFLNVTVEAEVDDDMMMIDTAQCRSPVYHVEASAGDLLYNIDCYIVLQHNQAEAEAEITHSL